MLLYQLNTEIRCGCMCYICQRFFLFFHTRKKKFFEELKVERMEINLFDYYKNSSELIRRTQRILMKHTFICWENYFRVLQMNYILSIAIFFFILNKMSFMVKREMNVC